MQGKDPLTSARSSDLATYDRHWAKLVGKYSVNDAGRVPVELVRRYLASEVADTSAVEAVLDHLALRGSVDQAHFQALSHLLHMAVRAAQEAVFSRDDLDLWGDAPAASHDKAKQRTDQEQDWVIGTLMADLPEENALEEDPHHHFRASRPFSGEDNSHRHAPRSLSFDGVEGAQITAEPQVPPAEYLGPLAAGLRAMSASHSGARSGPSTSRATSAASGAASIGGSSPADSPTTSTAGGGRCTDGPATSTSPWKAFDQAFSQLRVSDAPADRPQLAWAARHPRQLSLAEATSKLAAPPLPGTNITPMEPSERTRCEAAFQARGFAASGGAAREDAQHIFDKTRLPQGVFAHVWQLAAPSGAPRLDCRRFCLLVHLLKAAAAGETLPPALGPSEEAVLLGDFAPGTLAHGHGSRRASTSPPMRLDAHRLRTVLHAHGDGRTGEDDAQAAGGEAPLSARLGYGDWSDGGDSDSDAESVASYASMAVPASLPPAPRLPLPHLAALRTPGTGGKGTPRAGERGDTCIPQLAAPASARGALPVSRMERAMWEEEAGPGHSRLELILRSAALTQRKTLDRPFVCVTVRDPMGRLVELPQDSHPGMFSHAAAAVDFGGQTVALQTHLRALPPGCLLFLEMKQWKPEKKKLSTVAWSFVQTDMMGERQRCCSRILHPLLLVFGHFIHLTAWQMVFSVAFLIRSYLFGCLCCAVDSGPVCSRVRCGPMVLPLFKKPVDFSLRRLKRLNAHGPAMHVTVRGVE